MLSACLGSFNRRYRSARSSAAGIPLARITLSLNSVSRITLDISDLLLMSKEPEESSDRVVELVYSPFLERNDRVVSDLDAFRADGRATLRDVAVADAFRLDQFLDPVFGV